jgi:glucose-6-phosphate 1-dehydrogenase
MTPPSDAPAAAPSAALVVFGATGDLASRKLYPALTALAERGQLP